MIFGEWSLANIRWAQKHNGPSANMVWLVLLVLLIIAIVLGVGEGLGMAIILLSVFGVLLVAWLAWTDLKDVANGCEWLKQEFGIDVFSPCATHQDVKTVLEQYIEDTVGPKVAARCGDGGWRTAPCESAIDDLMWVRHLPTRLNLEHRSR